MTYTYLSNNPLTFVRLHTIKCWSILFTKIGISSGRSSYFMTVGVDAPTWSTQPRVANRLDRYVAYAHLLSYCTFRLIVSPAHNKWVTHDYHMHPLWSRMIIHSEEPYVRNAPKNQPACTFWSPSVESCHPYPFVLLQQPYDVEHCGSSRPTHAKRQISSSSHIRTLKVDFFLRSEWLLVEGSMEEGCYFLKPSNISIFVLFVLQQHLGVKGLQVRGTIMGGSAGVTDV